jgi:inner membrane protein
MDSELRGVMAAIRGSHMLRLLLIGFLVLVLLIPAAMIAARVRERRSTRAGAVDEVTAKWGKLQVITGPALIVPYVVRRSEVDGNGRRVVREETHRLTILPETLAVRGQIDSEVRHRGIFSVPVYRMRLEVSGRFAWPDLAELDVDPATVAWDRAELGVGITDARAIQEQVGLTWNQGSLSFLPGPGLLDLTDAGIHAPLAGAMSGANLEFTFPLVLNGSVGVYFVPFGRETRVELRSNWPDPSFQGNWLPTRRSVTDGGFDAAWNIPFLGRNYPQAWTSQEQGGDGKGKMSDTVEASKFGLDLITPVDQYRMAERSTKYAGLFILLTFAAIWLIEVLGGVRVHPIQYLLVGAAICLFFLLELALSEHIGFGRAYLLASFAVVGLIASYSLAALKSPGRAGIVGGLVAALYAYLYVLLNNEDYALLIGSVGLFLMLGAIMYLTRRIDWYAMGGGGK